MRRFSYSDPGFESAFAAFVDERRDTPEEVDAAVRDVLAAVRADGLEALLRFAREFDRVELDEGSIRVTAEEIEVGAAQCPAPVREAIAFAAARIAAYHGRQRPADAAFTDEAGVELGWRWTPLEAVGIYVPGGRAAYPSTVLMNAVPAKVAGVERIAMVTPPGKLQPAVLAAAKEAGVTEIWRVGGAQAVAALAYGAGPIRPVDKIVGPGNAYVASAKRRVFGACGIDMIAGPSEILVLCDGTTDPVWVAMDLFSQAEHDELAQAILLCPDAAYIAKVEESIARLLPTMPRQATISTSLQDRGALIKVRSMEEACEIANSIAAEHLEISADNPQQWAERIRHAGAMFLGRFSSESLGDYCCGPNHVLPTSRTARFSSPLGVYDFQKRSSIIHVSEAGAQTLGRVAATLAYGEGLQAHARSAELRLKPQP